MDIVAEHNTVTGKKPKELCTHYPALVYTVGPLTYKQTLSSMMLQRGIVCLKTRVLDFKKSAKFAQKIAYFPAKKRKTQDCFVRWQVFTPDLQNSPLNLQKEREFQLYMCVL
jgi:hypothetical protein